MKLLNLILSIFLVNTMVVAQEGFDEYLRAGTEDATTLLENYIDPFVVGLGSGLGNGWINTAESHSVLGFDINFSLTFAQIPDESQYFRFNAQDYQFITLDNPSGNQLPTVFGPDQAGSNLTVKYTDDNGLEQQTSFAAPAGIGMKEKIGFNAVPMPITQLGVGLFKNTDLKVRFWPKTNLGNTKASLIGVGLMHDLKQWIPGLKLLPFHWTIFTGYTRLNTSIDLSRAGLDGSGQNGSFNISNLNIQTVLSKKIGFLTFYSSFGYSRIMADMAMEGEYIVKDGMDNTIEVLNDPLTLDFAAQGLRGTLGMRLKFAVFTMYGDYTFNEYPMINFGTGFTFR